MSALLSDDELHEYLDKIAEHGCAEVNRLIVGMESGEVITELKHLDKTQRTQVLRELKQVMQVYDSCEIKT